ncbi:PilN domain-containing protein [Paraburkholderia gardini]|uniref:PilN domain-containing protein n=1 Tax=Paraburkholderia gardini TaxID=2823469 RepID=UPI001D5B8186|nr:PilN domain-containing protein [Paraburkholderia gardini]CAG4902102.1 hypothetical protein R69919_02914 [Paraburkholderia gardini]
MARLRWNFAGARWWAWPSAAVCIVALAGCAHALWWRRDLLLRREYLIGQAREASRNAPTSGQQDQVAPPVALDQVFAEMRYPWNDVLDSLQRVTRPGVDLLTLEPDASTVRRVRISGVAERPADLFDLIAKLQEDSSWSSVQLVSQTRTDGADMQRTMGAAPSGLPAVASGGISFALVAEWVRP